MELEGFKSAWQQRRMEGYSLSPPGDGASRSVRFLRISAARDIQRSEELSRLIFSLLFGLVAVSASFVVMVPGAGRVVAWMFAAALLVDGVAGFVLLVRRLRQAATDNMIQFISREYRQVEARLRIEIYTQGVMLILAAAAVVLLVFGPGVATGRDNVFRMGIVTAFLAVAWRRGRSRSRSREISHELRNYLKDLEA